MNYNSSTYRFNEKFFDSNLEYLAKIEKLLRDGDITEKRIEYYVNFCTFTSVYLLLHRISMIEDKSYRSEKSALLITKEVANYLKAYVYTKELIVRIVYFLTD